MPAQVKNMSSVYAKDRSRTGFTPIDNAADLMDEVAAYVMKEKYVPKKLRYLLGEDLIRKTDEIYDNATYANEIYAKKENMAKRRAYWTRAKACCKQLDRKLQRLRNAYPEATLESMEEIIKLLNAEEKALAERIERERG